MIVGVHNCNWWNVKNDPAGRWTWDGSIGSDAEGHAMFMPGQEFWAARAFVRNSAQMIHNGGDTPRRFFQRYTHVVKDQLPYAEFVAGELNMGLDDPFEIFDGDEIVDEERLIRLMKAVPQYEIFRGFVVCEAVIRTGIAAYERTWG